MRREKSAKDKNPPQIQALFIRPYLHTRPVSKKLHLAVDFSWSFPREEANKYEIYVSRQICTRVWAG
jgi:hypothetical protein